MKNKNIITLHAGGKAEKTIELSKIVIPDLWTIAQLPELVGYSIGGKSAKDLILETWHLAHEFKKELELRPNRG
jgi:hypothetical protein